MAYELKGKIEDILELQQVTDSFKKREFVVKIVENGYENLIKMQVTQKNCDLLESLKPNDNVKVLFSLKGRKWEKEGKIGYFTNLEAFNVRKDDESSSNDASNDVSYVDEIDEEVPF